MNEELKKAVMIMDAFMQWCEDEEKIGAWMTIKNELKKNKPPEFDWGCK